MATGKNKEGKDGPNVVMIEYGALGTIAIDELAQALWEDIHVLMDSYNVRFVAGVRFFVPVTNPYGEPLIIRNAEGLRVNRIDTHHYRPACLDYRL